MNEATTSAIMYGYVRESYRQTEIESPNPEIESKSYTGIAGLRGQKV